MKRGFSLAELLVSLAIISVIAAVLMPSIKHTVPNSSKLFFKSAYRTLESVVSELTNDTSLYGTGFDKDGSGNTVASARYFCDNFASKLNLIGNSDNCTQPFTYVTGDVVGVTAPNFTTTNGMRWYGLYNDFAAPPVTIWIDVDGVNKGLNKVGSDILRVTIAVNGKLTVDQTPEINYLQDAGN